MEDIREEIRWLSVRKERERGKESNMVKERAYPQTGKSNIFIDKPRKALPPGWRTSKRNNRYLETRKNRSDKIGSTI